MEEFVRRGLYGRADDLRRLLTFEKLKGTLHDFLYSMESAKIEFLEYQFKPVLAFLNSPTERLLLADEVGLGKTIEAALIWLELQARRDARRLLVVCPKMLARKWRLELREKFSIQAEIGGVEQLRQAVDDVRREGTASAFAWICTYSGLRPSRRDVEHLDDPEESGLSERGQLCRAFQEWDRNYPLFDLAIFDEAHYMRNAATATFQLGCAIANAANALLLISATPVNNAGTDLFTLLRLLDPDFFSNEAIVNRLLEENRPALQALHALNRFDKQAAAEALARLRNSPFVGRSELLQEAIRQLHTWQPGDHAGILTVLEAVERLNIVSRYISRTRRVQVKERRPIRAPLVLSIQFNEPEMRFYRAVTQMVRSRAQNSGAAFPAFCVIQPQLQTASCIPAMAEAFRKGDLGDPAELLHEAIGLGPEDDEELTPAPVEDGMIKEWAQWDFEAQDSKYAALRKLLLEQLPEEKILIFAFFRGTLRYLHKRLRAEGVGCALIHGDLDDEERAAAVEAFRDRPDVRVLLASEVGSEGIDLQFCRVLVNYDLPWNPMRIEQRIGRIDRVGQKAERLTIVHFKVRDTIEERLYEKLHSKLRVFEGSIGDLEPVLGPEIQRLTRELLRSHLTPEEEERLIEQSRLAIENRRRWLATLEAEHENLLAHADFIASQVNRHRSLGRYIAAHDLRMYISDFFARNYKGCTLQWDVPEPGCFLLELTYEARERLHHFMRREGLHAPPQLHSRRIAGTLIPAIAQEAAGRRLDSSLLLITHGSPLVRWITDENRQAKGVFHPLSAFRLRSATWPTGVYVYRVERWKFTGLQMREYLAYGVARFPEGPLLEPDDAERFFQAMTREGESWYEPNIESERVLTALEQVAQDLGRRFEQQYRQYMAENADTLAIYTEQVTRHFQRRLEANRQRIETMRQRGRALHMIELMESNSQKDRQRLNEKLASLKQRATPASNFSSVAAGIVEVWV